METSLGCCCDADADADADGSMKASLWSLASNFRFFPFPCIPNPEKPIATIISGFTSSLSSAMLTEVVKCRKTRSVNYKTLKDMFIFTSGENLDRVWKVQGWSGAAVAPAAVTKLWPTEVNADMTQSDIAGP